jgi:hypothetical protein
MVRRPQSRHPAFASGYVLPGGERNLKAAWRASAASALRAALEEERKVQALNSSR